MKQILQFLFVFIVASSTVFGQVAIDGYPDYNHDDLDGNNHHFYGYLEEGKIVVNLFFSVWDVTCQERAEAFNEVARRHGPEGDNTAVIIGLESMAETSDQAAKSWPAEYPVINTVKGCSDKPNCGTPHYYVTCPDGYWTKIDGSPETIADKFTQAIAACPTYERDASVLDLKENIVVCDGMVHPEFTIYNRGSETLTNTDVVVKVDGQIQTFFAWEGELEQFATETVAITPFPAPITGGIYDLSIQVANPNGSVDEQVINDEKNSNFYVIEENVVENLTFSVNPDFYPEELVWQVKTNDQSVILAEGRGYSGAFTQSFCGERGACYKLYVYDESNDGFESGGGEMYQNGYEIFKFTSDDHNTGVSEFTFCLENNEVSGNGPTETGGSEGSVTNIEENFESSLNIYPNPSKGNITIAYDYDGQIEMSIVNLLGKKVMDIDENSRVNGNITLNLSDLNDGVYFLYAETNEGVSSHKIVVSR